MAYARIKPATVEVNNLRDLLVFWKAHGDTGLVGTFKCRAPLTAAQIRRLPAGLRACLAAR